MIIIPIIASDISFIFKTITPLFLENVVFIVSCNMLLVLNGRITRKPAELFGHAGLETVQVYTKVRPHTLRE